MKQAYQIFRTAITLSVRFGSFHFAFNVILNQFAPLKQKLIRNNNQPFTTKTLRKAIMKRSKLRNKFNEESMETHLGHLGINEIISTISLEFRIHQIYFHGFIKLRIYQIYFHCLID